MRSSSVRIVLSGLLLLLASAAWPSAGMAQVVYPYTFRVPVAATNLPAGSAINVGCLTFTGPNNAGLATAFSPNVPVSNGAYSGVITVTQSSTVVLTSYACWVQVWLNNNVINTQNVSHFDAPATPGWTGTMWVTGNL
jgi:hypothetical protein